MKRGTGFLTTGGYFGTGFLFGVFGKLGNGFNLPLGPFTPIESNLWIDSDGSYVLDSDAGKVNVN